MNESRRPAPNDGCDQFLALAAHELRSPLNGIKSWAHVLERQLRDHVAAAHAARGRARRRDRLHLS
jgi:signal transduction histidine kinase